MYRERIRDYYDHLSRSYRRVADFVMSNYYEVSFMTAAELAFAVGVDTTTVVRFSQRLGYKGYPDLLQDIRGQVKAEIYAAYEPQSLFPDNPAAVFKQSIENEQHNLSQMLVYNPPEHIEEIAAMLAGARSILLIGEGYAETVVILTAQQLRHRGVVAEAASSDLARLAGTLATLASDTLVIGVSATAYGRDVARAMEFARSRGCSLLGVVGSLNSPVNRTSDRVIYAPTNVTGPLPSIVGLSAALAALVTIASRDSQDSVEHHREAFGEAYEYLIRSEDAAPEDPA